MQALESLADQELRRQSRHQMLMEMMGEKPDPGEPPDDDDDDGDDSNQGGIFGGGFFG
jgi:hypothetical protein